MMWILLGIIFFVITLWSLKGASVVEYHYECKNREYAPVWFLIIALILYCIPIIGIITFILYNIVFFVLARRKPHNNPSYVLIELSDKNLLHKILNTIIQLLDTIIHWFVK